MKLKKIAIAITATIMMTGTGTASASGLSDMQGFFNEIGAYGNASAPNVFRGQTRDYVTGGSLNLRVPNKTYQIATFDPPRLSASCSGIDAFAGSFSFINSDQLVQMMQNIGNNAAGAIFSLALESVSPQLNAVLKFFQDMANKVNALNVNSCQAATGIVTAAANGALGKGLDASLKGLGSSVLGIGDDWSNMVEKFQDTGSNTAQQTLDSAENSSNLTADEKMWLEPGNLIWKALGKVTASGSGLSDTEKHLIQSLVGTVIIKNETDADGKPKQTAEEWWPLMTNPLTDLMGDAPSSNVSITRYTCADSTCNDLTGGYATETVPSLRKIIHDKITVVQDKVMNRSGGVTVSDFEIVNMSFLPVWTMIETEYRTGGVLSTINNSEEVIAMAYTKALLDRTLHAVRLSLNTFKKNNTDAGVEGKIRDLEYRIGDIMRDVNKSYETNINKFNAFMTAKQALDYEAIRVREATAKQLMMANQQRK
jgi:conjugative transfer pilus assembly protein TraH